MNSPGYTLDGIHGYQYSTSDLQRSNTSIDALCTSDERFV